MPRLPKIYSTLALVPLALLSGCFSSDAPDQQGAFISGLPAAYESLGASPSGAMAVADLLDTDYLDSGITKPDVLAALKAEGDAASASVDYSSYPQVKASNVVITCSGASALCNVTVTYTNADADSVSVSHTTQIRLTDKFRLYGNQSKT